MNPYFQPIVYVLAKREHEPKPKPLTSPPDFFELRFIPPPDDWDSAQHQPHEILSHLPLDEIAANRSQIVAILYCFEDWEQKIWEKTKRTNDPNEKPNVTHAIVRKFSLVEFRGIPFFLLKQKGSQDSSKSLADKWNIYTDELAEQSILEEKFASAIAELNVGFLSDPYPQQLTEAELRKLQPNQTYNEETLRRAISSTLGWVRGEPVELKPISSGKSGAKVFIASANSKSPILIKIAPWLIAQQEYNGFQFVISPRLKNYIANIIPVGNNLGPVMIDQRMGVIAYSIVGYPGKELQISSLHQQLQDQSPQVVKRIENTLNHLLAELHKEPNKKSNIGKETIWGWLGDVIPAPYSGCVVTDDTANTAIRLVSYRRQGIRADSAARLAELAWHEALKTKQPLKLERFLFSESDPQKRQIILRHPDLGFRIICRFKPDNTTPWLPLWARIGMPITLTIKLDAEPVSELPYKHLTANLEQCGDLHDLLFPTSAPPLLPLSLTFPAKQGTIHGDLNLENIIFSGIAPESGSHESGWLIDFERSRADGLVAFDYAKLEIELFHHHILAAILELGVDDPDRCHAILSCLLQAIDASTFDINQRFLGLLPKDQFSETIIHWQGYQTLEQLILLLATIRQASLRIINRDKIRKIPTEMALALSLYAFTALKFPPSKTDDQYAQLMLTIAKHYANKWLPTSMPELNEQEFNRLCQKAKRQNLEAQRQLDAQLISLPQQSLIEITRLLQGTSEPLSWGQDQEAWDVASTGSVANITPILGYLWLQVKRQLQKDNGNSTPLVIPKISSTGNSCGTVDILQAGGYEFTSDIETIRERIEQEGGLFCEQDEERVPVDKITMKRRKDLNLMKDPKLTLASILAKKILMGCTHAVIDVKLGRDTKLIPTQGYLLADILPLCGLSQPITELLPNGEILDKAKALLRSLLQGLYEEQETTTQLWLQQFSSLDNSVSIEKNPPPKHINILFTSADTPQCRAIGRKLILLQLEQLFTDNGFDTLPSEYRTLYLERLPQAIGIEVPHQHPQAISIEAPHQYQAYLQSCWEKLTEKLPLLKTDPTIKQMDEQIKTPSTAAHGILNGHLAYYHFKSPTTGLVQSIDAYALDQLFGWLSDKGEEHDPDVGFWLHKLPGEDIKQGQVLITTFYRPNSQKFSPESIQSRIYHWFSQAVRFDQAVEIKQEANSMRILSWNIQWGKGVDNHVDPERIAAYIEAQKPDIIALQEVCRHYPANTGDSEPDQPSWFEQRLQNLLGNGKKWQAIFSAATDTIHPQTGVRQQFGNMILTHYPIYQIRHHTLPRPADPDYPGSQRAALELLLQTPVGVCRFITTHLEYYSPRQRQAQVDYLRQCHREGCDWFFHPPIRRNVSDTPMKSLPFTNQTLICGDLNAAPDNPTIKHLLAPFDDDTPALYDSWRYCYPNQPHPPTLGLDNPNYPAAQAFCADYLMGTTYFLSQIQAITIDDQCRASDHQPLLIEF